jgi:hypothetical protein
VLETRFLKETGFLIFAYSSSIEVGVLPALRDETGDIDYLNACYISNAVTLDFSRFIYSKVKQNRYETPIPQEIFGYFLFGSTRTGARPPRPYTRVFPASIVNQK